MQLIALIRKDELNVQEEREVYNAVLKWVYYLGQDLLVNIHIMCYYYINR